MLAAFCLRLAFGMVVYLPMLPPRAIHPRFFRTQFLTALGLTVVAALSAWPDASLRARCLLAGATGLSLAGALSWTLERPPLGLTLAFASAVVSASAAVAVHPVAAESRQHWLALADAISSGLLLGAAVTGMLVGHSYLISPGMSIRPLIMMLAILAVALALRVGVIAWGWAAASAGGLVLGDTLANEYLYYVVPRWVAGIAAPTVLGLMAYLTARIRSTQSATGILFVAVICTFLGELIGLIIVRMMGLPL